METKDELITHIKAWIKKETEIKQLQQEIKTRRLEKKKLSDELIEVMQSNDIDAFNINNGKLLHQKIKSKETISKKMLLRVLSNYFNDDKDANNLTQFILESREVKETDKLRIKLNKK